MIACRAKQGFEAAAANGEEQCTFYDAASAPKSTSGKVKGLSAKDSKSTTTRRGTERLKRPGESTSKWHTPVTL